MSFWQRKLELMPEWGDAKERKITPQEMASVVAKRLKALKSFTGYEVVEQDREELIDEFESLAEDGAADFDDFDGVMHRLWDWGDTPLDGKFGGKKVCWINTFRAYPVVTQRN